MRHAWIRRSLAAFVLAVVSGCCAQVGVGVGLGADVRVPVLLHTGLEAGSFVSAGPHYGKKDYSSEGRWIPRFMLPFGHVDGWEIFITSDHACWAVLPVATETNSTSLEADPGLALEVGLMLGVLELRWGVNPSFVAHDQK
jgi:hypothetical protein